MRGRERLEAVTRVAQRVRLADPVGGVWEAADLQWWWRQPRPTDDLLMPVWNDQTGPCAAISVMDCLGRSHAGRSDASAPAGLHWQADLFAVPGTVDLQEVWSALLGMLQEHRPALTEIAVRDDDQAMIDRLEATGFTPIGDPSPIIWMDTANRLPVLAPPQGFRIVDRMSRPTDVHPMGNGAQARLRQCSLYDPTLDLAMIAPNGQLAGFGLFWADPVTGVGILEPIRINEPYQRQGLAKTLLAHGLDRLAHKDIRRIKVTFARYAGHELHARGVFTTTGSARMWKSTLIN